MNDLSLVNPSAAGELARRMRHGELPLIAPKVILDTPMWLDPRKASKVAFHRQEYTNLLGGTPIPCTVEITNNLPLTGRGSAGGVLRYLDLDVLMALSLAWTQAGCPSGPSAALEIEQRAMLNWLGFENLTRAPYVELRASLERLEFTTIALWSGSETPPPGTRPFRLLEGQTMREDQNSQGKPKIINVRLADVWREALANIHDWQAVDVYSYAHLAKTNRRLGLARVLFLYLMCSRQKDESFSVPMTMVRDRFAQRRPNGSLVYANPLDERGALGKAIKHLHQSGVVTLDDQPSRPLHQLRLSGSFNRTVAPTIGFKENQTYFIAPGMWDDQPRLVEPQNEADQSPKNPQAKQSTVEAQPQDTTATKLTDREQRYQRFFAALRDDLGATNLSQALVDKTIRAGASWENCTTILLVAQARGIEAPAAYAATVLRSFLEDAVNRESWTYQRAHENIPGWEKDDYSRFSRSEWKRLDG